MFPDNEQITELVNNVKSKGNSIANNYNSVTFDNRKSNNNKYTNNKSLGLSSTFGNRLTNDSSSFATYSNLNKTQERNFISSCNYLYFKI